jgi:hypothetical protein
VESGEEFVAKLIFSSGLWYFLGQKCHISGFSMIFLCIIDILILAIEAQYYILGEYGKCRCISYVPTKASKINLPRSSLHGLHHGWTGEPSNRYGRE